VGAERDVISNGARKMVFVEIEIKDTGTGKIL